MAELVDGEARSSWLKPQTHMLNALITGTHGSPKLSGWWFHSPGKLSATGLLYQQWGCIRVFQDYRCSTSSFIP